MAPLHESLRRGLERQVVRARELAEEGAEAALARLAVAAKEPHGHLRADERLLRNRLRERARALGDQRRPNAAQDIERLLEEVAYEAWHRMLFARFLAENNLLVHPEHGVSVSLAECEELALEEGAEDKWVLAARYASRMLPQIFRPNDPSLQVSFAPEHRIGLEQLLEELPPELFRADDSLGWVYQFWQSERKDEVNAAGETITAETLPAVTQLFTEPYMVSFLLENTLGAWWSARHPGESLPIEMPYLRRLEDGTPAASTFAEWPARWGEVTMLDPCCGSGHFLVAALRLIVPLRMSDEGLSAIDAVNAVLRENLYGLELDPRCTQIAAFAVALAAWTMPGAHGYRPLPELQIACSGLAVGARKEEWLSLAEGDQKLVAALGRLYDLFTLAPEVGSLIDPTAGGEDLLTVGFAEVKPFLERALGSERAKRDEKLEATAIVAQGITKAGQLLGGKYTLVATNVPYLGRIKQDKTLQQFTDQWYARSRADLATVFVERCLKFNEIGGFSALVTPQTWLFLSTYRRLREYLLTHAGWHLLARLGAGAFEGISGEIVNVALLMLSNRTNPTAFTILDVSAVPSARAKAAALRTNTFARVTQASQLTNPEARLSMPEAKGRKPLGDFADCYKGISSGDYPRFGRCYWEVADHDRRWKRQQSTVTATKPFGGMEHVFLWEGGSGKFHEFVTKRLNGAIGAWVRGQDAWGKRGVAVTGMQSLPVSLYFGDAFDNNVTVIIPRSEEHLAAIWAFCSSSEYNGLVRQLNPKLSVTDSSFVQVPFDLDRWTEFAKQQYPTGLPTPQSDDPTQWLFKGQISSSTAPLQVAVARLAGYRWPDQPENQSLDALADSDGIVCLPAVRGETPASDRLNAFLATAYGSDWSPAVRDALLSEVGFAGKTLDDWLRDAFFEQHTKLFHQRPFIWHLTDKAKGGFSALVNYHKLHRKTLEALTYTYLGDWITRQEEARKREERGADIRVAAAKGLQESLRLILEGEPPYDIFVRWKSLHEQPLGWEPDLNDGVRLNIWPFIQTGVLRSKVNVNWKKDRGLNLPGSNWGDDRYNRYEDIPAEERPAELRNVDHLTNDVKRSARSVHEKSAQTKSAPKPAASSR